jgi:hypothetical protein
MRRRSWRAERRPLPVRRSAWRRGFGGTAGSGGFPEPAIDDTLGTAILWGRGLGPRLPAPLFAPDRELRSGVDRADNPRMGGGLVERPWDKTAWEPS